MSGKEQDLALGVLRFHLDRQFDAGNTRHRNVRYEQIGSFCSGCGQRLQWASEEPGGEAIHLQDGDEGGCDDGFIIDHEDSCQGVGRHIGPLPSIFS